MESLDNGETMRGAQEEVFGPAICVINGSDKEDMTGQANSSPNGLSAGILIWDLNQAHRLARAGTGMVFVSRNKKIPAGMPFG